MARVKKGMLIAFEGGEGGGKSTQIRRLVGWLRARGLPCEVTCEPGGTSVGKVIRRLLLHPKYKGLSPRAELFLYLADRAQHVDEAINGALGAGKVVVSDRFSDSSTVYQGICRDLGLKWTEQLNHFATAGLLPDLVIVLDVPVSEGLRRVVGRSKPDRLEQERASFHRRVRKGFLSLAKRHPSRYLVVNGTRTKEQVAELITERVQKELRRKGL
ncbi:MAG: dTMP kinase [Deltaproteobacteria bacterium]|nr:dTMP kinase [Deltaproteobacteria bacterium]